MISETLRDRCAEILQWKRTGILTGDVLRAHASAIKGRFRDSFDMGQALQMAESETAREAMEAVLSVTPAAVAGSVTAMTDPTGDALKAYSTPAPVTDVEPVAWRWRWQDTTAWILTHQEPSERHFRVVEPLFSSPPAPVQQVVGLTPLETELLTALKRFRDTIIGEVHDKWDEGMRAGKLIVALANPTLPYRRDISEIHETIAKAEARAALEAEGSAEC